jgi:hypothetical protein
MVDSFTSATPYSFEIDSKPYVLPGLSFGDIDSVADAMSGDTGQQLLAAKSILFDRSDARTKKAIMTLGLGSLGSLFRKWAGVEPGESSSSPESSESTDAS